MTPRPRVREALGAVATALLAVALGCGPNDGASPASASASGTPDAPPVASAELLAQIRAAEAKRDLASVPAEALRATNPSTRALAARAVARIGGPQAREALRPLLVDEAPEVVRWAAYGIGFECARDPDAQIKQPLEVERTVSALAARATTLPDDPSWDAAHEALLRGLAGCSKSSMVEPTLVAWLASERRGCAAALALGDFVMRTKRLREESWVSLLNRAAGSVSSPPCRAAFFAFSRVPHLPPSVEARFVEVAGGALGTPDPYRLMLVRGLSRGGRAAVPLLRRVLVEEPASFTMPERLEALRAAVRLEDAARALVDETLVLWGKLEPSDVAEGSDAVQLALAAIALLPAGERLRPAFDRVTSLTLDAPSDRQKRILSMLRCRALSTWAVSALDPTLVKCDVDTAVERKRAQLAVLARTTVGPKELALFEELAKDEVPLVREAALAILVKQPALPRVSALVRALGDERSGVVSAAAEALADHPSLGARTEAKPKKTKDKDGPGEGDLATVEPDAAVVAALAVALDRGVAEKEPELVDLSLRAIGGVGAKTLAEKVEPFCTSAQPTTRAAAATALKLLRGAAPACDAPAQLPEVSFAEGPSKAKLTFVSDAGDLVLTLDGAEASWAAARFVDLAKRGWFDGNVLHRVDPSYVVQFGSPSGDGYGGPIEDAPLPCETGPRPFDELAVGVALSGRDTGKSQLFVTRGRHPHIDGAYPVIGRAEGPWARVIEGDTIRSVRVE